MPTRKEEYTIWVEGLLAVSDQLSQGHAVRISVDEEIRCGRLRDPFRAAIIPAIEEKLTAES